MVQAGGEEGVDVAPGDAAGEGGVSFGAESTNSRIARTWRKRTSKETCRFFKRHSNLISYRNSLCNTARERLHLRAKLDIFETALFCMC